ncbi:MAG TPA: hypothetical protein VKA92_04125 [Segetibacter sp.]|nr:hypothetical protein [Segetibacter sp.]
MFSRNIHLVECPRDAMQGWEKFIPTEKKVNYLNSLLNVGFDTLDCGSFVSAKAIPQMADTKDVIRQLSLDRSKTKLLVIVANKRGAEEAVIYDNITFLGFPFSVSPTFQVRNTNSTLEESLQRIEDIQNLCFKNNKHLVVYLSMGFGNPYGDEYNEETLLHWAGEMVKRSIGIISVADTVGMATPGQIDFALNTLIPAYPQAAFGVHLHSTAADQEEKLAAAVNAGCKRFDGTLKGIGGCPMASNELVGNMNSEWMIEYFKTQQILSYIDEEELQKALLLTKEIFQ